MVNRDDRDEARMDDEVRAAYRETDATDTAARARLLATLAARPTGLRWWFAPNAFRARPAWVFAAMLGVLVAGAWIGARLVTPPGLARDAASKRTAAALAQAEAEGTQPVTFVLRAPGATRVSVVGDFNNWDAEATPMAHSGSGDLWVLSVKLPRGVHLYSFVLDGTEWRPDPSAPLAADDSFGGHNSVVVVDGVGGL